MINTDKTIFIEAMHLQPKESSTTSNHSCLSAKILVLCSVPFVASKVLACHTWQNSATYPASISTSLMNSSVSLIVVTLANCCSPNVLTSHRHRILVVCLLHALIDCILRFAAAILLYVTSTTSPSAIQPIKKSNFGRSALRS